MKQIIRRWLGIDEASLLERRKATLEMVEDLFKKVLDGRSEYEGWTIHKFELRNRIADAVKSEVESQSWSRVADVKNDVSIIAKEHVGSEEFIDHIIARINRKQVAK